jgi:hypothetical protein
VSARGLRRLIRTRDFQQHFNVGCCLSYISSRQSDILLGSSLVPYLRILCCLVTRRSLPRLWVWIGRRKSQRRSHFVVNGTALSCRIQSSRPIRRSQFNINIKIKTIRLFFAGCYLRPSVTQAYYIELNTLPNWVTPSKERCKFFRLSLNRAHGPSNWRRSTASLSKDMLERLLK